MCSSSVSKVRWIIADAFPSDKSKYYISFKYKLFTVQCKYLRCEWSGRHVGIMINYREKLVMQSLRFRRFRFIIFRVYNFRVTIHMQLKSLLLLYVNSLVKVKLSLIAIFVSDKFLRVWQKQSVFYRERFSNCQNHSWH